MTDLSKHFLCTGKTHSHSLGILFELSNPILILIKWEKDQETEAVKW